MPPTLNLIAGCVFAALLGFAAHRASVCTVRAVAEVLSARTAYMLASIGKSALWVIVLTLPFLWLMPAALGQIGGWQLTLTALFGGLLFGVGAAVNGGCAYSTMSRLVDGEVRMAVAIAGFAAGVIVYVALADAHWLSRPVAANAGIGSAIMFAAVLSILGLAWVLYEALRIWRRRAKHMRMHHRMLAPQYRLSTAALIIGLSGTAILLLIGSPGYTLTLQTVVQGLVGLGPLPAGARVVLLLSVLAGMLASTLQRGSFRIDWRPRASWLRNFSGGVLMGLGTAMLPGGNDALILYGIPTLSPHALPAFAALLIGVGVGLLAMKHIGGVNSRVVCSNDIYRIEDQPRGSILNSHRPQP